MSEERQPQVASFGEKMEQLASQGLVDLKFFVGNISESTMESFCREANSIDEALASKNFKLQNWRDNKQFLLG